ncbi:LysR family transcriptional regulator [Fictibacillus fluitans]|uniref:LysR family transcriptional regulator n=1 Tax=Fictibacillus fluitans TaxID=3058422 RepID=A0ABT8HWH7_9BACL|nr:LysR family transcriptional regulator [Fictibacillus sp. NE201]MDN4525096.1 LysR family transcriptional regulator [Fictibacillus sp. NE201]
MEWQQFEYFRTLAKMQHVTRAAKALSITQPALSRSITRFEEEIGVPLFERQGRSIRLNKYGQLFLQRVDNIMREFEEGKQEIQDLLDPNQGEVSIGFLHTLSTGRIPDLLSAFRQSYPKVNFRLGQGPSHQLIAKLLAGEFDLCLIASMESRSPIKWKPLWDEELYVIVPKDHKYAHHESISLEQIADESFIHLKEGFSLRITVEQLFQEAGLTPNITFEGEEADTAAALVAAGLGISILPNLKGTDQSKIVKIPIQNPHCQRTIGIAWVEGRYVSPATQKFKQFVLEQL